MSRLFRPGYETDMVNRKGEIMSFIGSGFIYGIIAFIISLIMPMMIVSYMRLYEEKKAAPTLSEITGDFIKKLPKSILALIVAFILTLLGFIFLLVPGIYLAVVFSLLVPVLMVEKNNAGSAINTCLNLIKDRFWQTFGFIIIIYIIISLASTVVQLPMIIFSVVKTFTGVKNNPGFMTDYISFMTIPNILSQLVSTLGFGVYTVAITIWYYTLAEEKYGIGAQKTLDSLQRDSNSTNEGDF